MQVAAGGLNGTVPGMPLLGTDTDIGSGDQHKELELPQRRYQHRCSLLAPLCYKSLDTGVGCCKEKDRYRCEVV